MTATAGWVQSKWDRLLWEDTSAAVTLFGGWRRLHGAEGGEMLPVLSLHVAPTALAEAVSRS